MTARGIWAAAVVLACSDAIAPAVPVQEAAPSATPDLPVAESQREPAKSASTPLAASATQDAADRVVASLERRRPSAALRETLTLLTGTLSGPDFGESQRLLRQARRLLDDQARGGDAAEVQAELDAIGLALDAAERGLAQ